MILNNKTLTKLRELINEGTEYRTGPKLVKFFNALGFCDTYGGSNFPSRWKYTEDKLCQINGTPELDRCIKEVFAPINFVEDINKLDKLIQDFNKYLVFDGWKVVRNNQNISFERNTNIEEVLKKSSIGTDQESMFLSQVFKDIPLDKIINDENIYKILQNRMDEAKQAIKNHLYLSAILLCGSILEGVLLHIEVTYPKLFNQATSSPKNKDGKNKPFTDWSLSDSINVAKEVGFLSEDVKKFSHVLRVFRNYIHPYEQMSHNFVPDEHTVNICFQVLKAALYQINRKLNQP